MNILSLEGVSKSFGVKPLFDGVNLGLDESDKVGVIGANGSGKTTLLRVIAGEEQPDSGRVVRARDKVVFYLSQNPQFDPARTVLDAVFEASGEKLKLLHDYEEACHRLAAQGGTDQALLSRVSDLAHELEVLGAWELEVEAKNVLQRLGLNDVTAKMGALSGGQRKRVALAHALVVKPDLLILDEPTNHLDAETVEWLEDFLADFRGALLLVTHDRYFLDRVTNRIIELDHGRVQRFDGNYAYYLEKKEEQELERAVAGQKRDALIRRELAWLRRGAKARTTKQKARVERAEALMVQPKDAPRAELEITLRSSRLGSKILALDGISKSYGDRVLIRDFSYTLKKGERIGVIGPNGAGKTTLVEIIAGRVKPDAGSVEIGETVVLGYYDQESRALDDEKRVLDYIREVAERVETADGEWLTASQMLNKFLFPPAMQHTPIAKLSGGERRRLYLLRMLMGAPNLMLFDEVTNDLDVPTLMVLEEYLDSFPGCLIVVSHDRYFLDRTVEKIFRFEGEGHIREYPGNYSVFLEIREREAAEAAAQNEAAALAARRPTDAAQTTTRPAPDAKRKLTFKEKRELEELEARIAAAEARQAEIETRMAAESSDYVLLQELHAELQRLQSNLDRDLNRWAELAELAGT
jgi:ABC transport system ATP-binding/permease protein